MREMNAQRVTITMTDGAVIKGFINIGSSRRLSDFFRKPENGPFVVMFDATAGQDEAKSVYFLNLSHVLRVEPMESEDRHRAPGDVDLESELN